MQTTERPNWTTPEFKRAEPGAGRCEHMPSLAHDRECGREATWTFDTTGPYTTGTRTEFACDKHRDAFWEVLWGIGVDPA